MPRRLTALIAALAWFWAAAAAPAQAECVGQDMMAELRTSDPAAHDQILARAHRVPNASGRFWKVERAEIAASYLFGTFHTHQAVDWVPAAAWLALDNADTAVFELSADQVAAMEARVASDPDFMFDAAAVPLSERLPPDALLEIRAALTERGVPGPLSEQMRPWMLFALLSFPPCHLLAQAQGNQPLDRVMSDRALAGGIREIGLETYEQALSAFQRVPVDQLLKMLTAQGPEFDREEDAFLTNLGFYARGEVSAIPEFGVYIAERHAPGPDYRGLIDGLFAELLDARNQAWMPVLERELARGNAFVGVGALHLPGDTGLIELLRARGYTVTLLAQ